jgi:RimJ/RimL family protein N-acetyltransferase
MIKNSSLTIRPGVSKDFPLYEKWCNTPLAFPKILKQQGNNSKESIISDIASEFEKLIASDAHLESNFYVIEGIPKEEESLPTPIAQVHLELLSPLDTNTSDTTSPSPIYNFYLFLHPEFHKQGLGKKVIRLAAKFLVKEKKIPKLFAEIHRRNTFAILCFSKAKFQFVQTTTHKGSYCQEYQYLP